MNWEYWKITQKFKPLKSSFYNFRDWDNNIHENCVNNETTWVDDLMLSWEVHLDKCLRKWFNMKLQDWYWNDFTTNTD